jgi:hypothetical protein
MNDTERYDDELYKAGWSDPAVKKSGARSMRIIAIDPGVMTGICYAEIEQGHLTYHPFQTTDDVDDLWDRLERFRPRFIVIEDFEFRRGKRSAGGLDLTPLQLIGVSRLYSLKAMHQCAIYVQKASTGKQYYTDRVLKQLKLYKRALPHGMDASRHLLQWAFFGPGYQFMQGTDMEESVTMTEKMEWWRGGDSPDEKT